MIELFSIITNNIIAKTFYDRDNYQGIYRNCLGEDKIFNNKCKYLNFYKKKEYSKYLFYYWF